MKEPTRFQLKHSTGWFAAGREVACALELLSDGLLFGRHPERTWGVVWGAQIERDYLGVTRPSTIP